MELSALPRVSIIVLNWNSRDKILRWLSSLELLDYPRDRVEVIVHDNASSDGSQGAIGRKFMDMEGKGWLNLVLLEARRDMIMVEAFNHAFSAVSRQSVYIWRLDNDVVPTPSSLRLMVVTAEAQADAGVVGCRAMFYDRPMTLNSGAVFINWWGGNNTNVDAPDTLECDVVQGCSMLIRRIIVDRLGFLFDPSLHFCHEEGDFCMRARGLGYKVFYEPRAIVYHEAGTTTGRTPLRLRYFFYRNGIIFMRRYNRFPQKQWFYLLEALSALKLFVLTGRGLGVRAVFDGLMGRRFNTKRLEQVLKRYAEN